MEFDVNRVTHSVRVKFSEQEWLRLMLQAEKTRLKVENIIAVVIWHGYKEYFRRSNEN